MPLINREIKTINNHVIKVMLIMNSSKNKVAIIIIDYLINCEWLSKKKKRLGMCMNIIILFGFDWLKNVLMKRKSILEP